MSDKLKGVSSYSRGPYGTGSTGGPWPVAKISPNVKAKLGGKTQSKHAFAKGAGKAKIGRNDGGQKKGWNAP